MKVIVHTALVFELDTPGDKELDELTPEDFDSLDVKAREYCKNTEMRFQYFASTDALEDYFDECHCRGCDWGELE